MKSKRWCVVFCLILIGLCFMGCRSETTSNIDKNVQLPAQRQVPMRVSIHVSNKSETENPDGTEAYPFNNIEEALEQVTPGATVLIHEGVYNSFEVGSACSGTPEFPVKICAAEGEKVTIKNDSGIGIYLLNVDNIVISDIEVSGGTHGIYYESTVDQGDKTLQNIAIQNCIVHDIVGTHGICVYGANDRAPIQNITVENCEVYDCQCGSSESVVLNGNIDGFVIRGNQIHHNDNIGIDMIGFEGTAKHPKGYEGNPYEVDFVRNGKCYDNVVYAITTMGNDAYLEENAYDLSAGGIYVDGGQDIEIYHNFVFGCDIGIEVATEHREVDNPLFQVSGVGVHDNIVANCEGYCGLAFGGYNEALGYTRNCTFYNNTLIKNGIQIIVQKSEANRVHHNLFIGGETEIAYADGFSAEEYPNVFEENKWIHEETKDVFAMTSDGYGADFSPEIDLIHLYEAWSMNRK